MTHSLYHDNTGLFGFLERASKTTVAVIHGKKAWNYSELNSAALNVAEAIAARGMVRGDRIAVMLPNGIEWLALSFGAALLGVAVVSINVRLGAKEVGDLLSRTRPAALVYDAKILNGGCVATLRTVEPPAFDSIRSVFCAHAIGDGFNCNGLAIEDMDVILSGGEPVEAPVGRSEADDPCLILATSGTTGQSKLIVHAQGRVARHMVDIARALGLDQPGSRNLVVMPFAGAFGYTNIMSTIAGGQTAIIADGFDAVATAELARTLGATRLGGTNDMLLNMLKADGHARPFPLLRAYVHANFTPSLIEMPPEAERRQVKIQGAYGLSELLALVALQPLDADLDRRAEAGGLLVDEGASFRIVDPDDGNTVADGELGEIQIRTPNAMLGYLDDAVATAEAFTADGYLRTGDLGRKLPDGGMSFDSRRNDVLRIGGYLVAPAEIEDLILGMKGIQACQIVAVRHVAGVRPVGFVIAGADAVDEATIIAGCRARLAKYKVPVRIFSVSEFPHVDGPNGKKVKRDALRDMAQRSLEENAA